MALFFFWFSFITLFYTYFGYQLFLRVLTFLLPSKNQSSPASAPLLKVSVIVACFNEEKVIEKRIRNLLALNYPKELLEIIIASDGSTDRTNEIARQFEKDGVVALALERKGKPNAHNTAVKLAKGDVIIFTDADTEFHSDYALATVRKFQSATDIGCVIGNLSWIQNNTGPGNVRQISWKREAEIRKMESDLGILASGSGAAMAVLKKLYVVMHYSTDDSDSLTPLDVISQGYRVVLAEEAHCVETPFVKAVSEYRAKVRGVSKSLTMIFRRWKLKDWISHPIIFWRMLSHHFLRWTALYFAVTCFISSLFLWNNGLFYQVFIALETLVLSFILVGYIADKFNKELNIASTLFTFAVLNLGMSVGLIKAATGQVKGTWQTE